MNKKFILALMLTTGMAFAQTGSSGSTPDQSSQQPSTTSPSTSPSTSSPSTADQTNSTTTSTTSTTSTSDQSNSMRGCLKQSGGNWVLAADNGQSVNLQGDSSMLKPHDGHQVQIQGSRASDGSVQVSSVNMISDSCTNNQASSAAPSDSSAASSAAATSATTPTSSTDQSAASNPPVASGSSQTPTS